MREHASAAVSTSIELVKQRLPARWRIVTGLIQIKIPDGLARIRRFFRPLHRFPEFFFQQVCRVSLVLNRLPEDRVATVILLLHSSRRFLNVIKSFWLYGRGMSNHCPVFRINLENRIAARASYVKRGKLRHIQYMIYHCFRVDGWGTKVILQCF